MRKPKDPEQSRAGILAAATDEFAERGFEGARLDAIAQRTSTTRAMIYYYFGDREALYLAVLEQAYRAVREAERALDISALAPEAALRRLVEFTFDYMQQHPRFVALVVAENQSGGRHIRKVERLQQFNRSIVERVQGVLDAGVRDGVFRPGVDALGLHMAMTALGWYQVANRHTFSHIFRRDLASRETIAQHRELACTMILSFLRPTPAPRDPARDALRSAFA